MPNYDYKCQEEECGYQFETYHSIKSKPLVDCPNCGMPSLMIILYPVQGFVKGEPQTLGALAERNTERLGTYGRQEMWAKNVENKELARTAAREELAAKLPAGASLPAPQKVDQWFRPGTSGPDMKLANLNKDQAKQFIEKGIL